MAAETTTAMAPHAHASDSCDHRSCCIDLPVDILPAWLVPPQRTEDDAGLLAMNPTANFSRVPDGIKLKPEITAQMEEMREMRRMLHAWPEMGFHEVKTSTYIEEQLRKLDGVQVVTKLGVTGLIGIYRGANPGPTIAFRADMDGLPVNERAEGIKSESWISKNPGVMHACGHDGHVTMLIAFARAVVAKWKPADVHGTIVFLFQPAEEGDGGAPKMLEDGVLTAGGLKDIDAFYGIHLSSGAPLGSVVTKAGPLMAGIDVFDIKVKGVGGHGAMPHQTVDSILVVTQLVNQLHTIISRNIDPMDTGVVTVGKISAGTANNVIADDATVIGTIRYFSEEVREKIHSRIQALCRGIEEGYGCNVTPNIVGNYPPTINHAKEADIVLKAAGKVVGPMAIRTEKGVMGSEDFSFFIQQRPGAFFFVGAALEADRLAAYPHHSPLFDFHEDAMAVGASVWMQLFEDLLVEPGKAARASDARL
ncbi:N-acyl-L-amino acid amidohydrolase [Hyaloraphidium curvatum]|nr:N-acyl-L-amino acid amidohydrolase [Hyaloraphidium curvatum]